MPDHHSTDNVRSKSPAPFDLVAAAPKLLDAMIASGIAFELRYVPREGFEARLGHKNDGYRAETQGLGTSIEAFMWLHQAVLQHYPNSDYAKAFLRR
jgi:hypothetical protein